MPATSAKQYRFMQMHAHNPEKANSKGPSPAVAKHFIEETPKKKKSIFSHAKDYFSGQYGAKQEKKSLKPPQNITGARG
jgi:hypothetical protein